MMMTFLRVSLYFGSNGIQRYCVVILSLVNVGVLIMKVASVRIFSCDDVLSFPFALTLLEDIFNASRHPRFNSVLYIWMPFQLCIDLGVHVHSTNCWIRILSEKHERLDQKKKNLTGLVERFRICVVNGYTSILPCLEFLIGRNEQHSLPPTKPKDEKNSSTENQSKSIALINSSEEGSLKHCYFLSNLCLEQTIQLKEFNDLRSQEEMKIYCEEFCMVELIERIVETKKYQVRISDKPNLVLDTSLIDYESFRNYIFTGSPMKIYEVMNNLITNSIKYSDDGVISLRCLYSATSGIFNFTCRDEGIGIPPEKLSKLGQPFNNINDTKNRQSFGLGLYITKQLVERELRGTIIFSSPGNKKGTTASIKIPLESKKKEPQKIPLKEQDEDEEEENSFNFPSPCSPTSERRKVVIVDQTRESAISLKLILSQFWENFEFVYFQSCQECADYLQQKEVQSSYIFVDAEQSACDMPILDFCNLLSASKRNKSATSSDVVVVVTTSLDFFASEEELWKHQIYHTLTKPYFSQNIKALFKNTRRLSIVSENSLHVLQDPAHQTNTCTDQISIPTNVSVFGVDRLRQYWMDFGVKTLVSLVIVAVSFFILPASIARVAFEITVIFTIGVRFVLYFFFGLSKSECNRYPGYVSCLYPLYNPVMFSVLKLGILTHVLNEWQFVLTAEVDFIAVLKKTRLTLLLYLFLVFTDDILGLTSHDASFESGILEGMAELYFFGNLLFTTFKKLKQENMYKQQLLQMNKKMEQLQQQKLIFLSRISHELRSPFAGAEFYFKEEFVKSFTRRHDIGKSELYEECSLNYEENNNEQKISEVKERILLILRSLSRVQQCVSNLFVICQHENSRMLQVLETMDFSKYFKKLIKDQISLTSNSKRVEFDFVNESGTNQHEFDPSVVDTVVGNMIGNALDFCPNEKIKIGGVLKIDKIDFFVEDFGEEGLKSQDFFDVFEMNKKSWMYKHRMMIGMFCSYLKSSMIGGSIIYDRGRKIGTKVMFSCPVRSLPEKKTKCEEEKVENKKKMKKVLTVKDMKVFCIDDFNIFPMMIERILCECGLESYHNLYFQKPVQS